MNHDEAVQHGLGYAAGREDASRIRTAEPGTTPGYMAFAYAYAQAWDDYYAERRFSMTNCRDAYDRWQASGGRSIFARGDLTLDELQRITLAACWPSFFSQTTDSRAYYLTRDLFQADAWDAAGRAMAGN